MYKYSYIDLPGLAHSLGSEFLNEMFGQNESFACLAHGMHAHDVGFWRA